MPRLNSVVTDDDAVGAVNTAILRQYIDADAAATLDVFLQAIRMTAATDYHPEQIAVWADPGITLDQWASKRRVGRTCVAEVDRHVVGFIDIDATGYIDMLYVAPHVSRIGVGTALLLWALDQARSDGLPVASVHASITARPLFEVHGFHVTGERVVEVRGVQITNYEMSTGSPSGQDNDLRRASQRSRNNAEM